MADQIKTPHVFISYARRDGLVFARRLREWLAANDIVAWQDVVGEEGGLDFWQQITKAIDEVQFVLLLMTPMASRSETVKKEWRYARQQGVCVYPVLVPDVTIDFEAIPGWMKNVHWYDLNHPEQWDKLLADLRRTYSRRRVPFMADDVPKNFVPRPIELAALVELLRDPHREDPIAITAALKGAGGFGKTVLARALCHDERIQEAFYDGVLWITLGEAPGDFKAKVLDLISILSGSRDHFETLEAASTRLSELLDERNILMVIDDVWNSADLAPFLRGGKRCARLITTRNRDTLPIGTRSINVDAMRRAEAIQLLRAGILVPDNAAAEALAVRLGAWPVLLSLVNAVLRDLVENAKQSPLAAISFVSRDLDEHGLTAFDAAVPKGRDQAIAATLAVSLSHVGTDTALYEQLAICPEDVDIPLSTLERLWAKAKLTPLEVEKVCHRLDRASLLSSFDLLARTIRVHDVIRSYLLGRLTQQKLAALHRALIRSWGSAYELPDAYSWRWYGYHLNGARLLGRLRKLLFDCRWLEAKLLTAGPDSLLGDFEYFRESADFSLLAEAIRLSAHLLSVNSSQFRSQLCGRLAGLPSEKIQTLLAEAANLSSQPWFRPLACCFNRPGGALIRTITVQSASIKALDVSKDGSFAVLGLSDGTVQLWNLDTAQEIRRFEAHPPATGTLRHGVTAVLMVEEFDRIVSASFDDNSIRIWELSTGKHLFRIADSIRDRNAIAAIGGGPLAVAVVWDSVILFDIQTGKLTSRIYGQKGWTGSVAVSPDGLWAVSASYSGIQVWNLRAAKLEGTLDVSQFNFSHRNYVEAVALTRDGRWLVSGDGSGVIRIWDTLSAQSRILADASPWVYTIALDERNRLLASGGFDRTVRLWDLDSGCPLHTFRDHAGSVEAVRFIPRRRVLSAASDGSLKIWNISSFPDENPYAHQDLVLTTRIVRDDKAVSVSRDGAISVWEFSTGRLLRTFSVGAELETAAVPFCGSTAVVASKKSGDVYIIDLESGKSLATVDVGVSEDRETVVHGLSVSADGRRVVIAEWTTVSLWEAPFHEKKTLGSHGDAVNGPAITPCGRWAATAGNDGSVRIWDLDLAREARRWPGRRWTLGIAIAPDALRVITSEAKNELVFWEADIGGHTATIAAHSDRIHGLACDAGFQRAISASLDHTARLWDIATGERVAEFVGEGYFLSCDLSSDGQHVMLGDSSGRVYFLRLEGSSGH